MPARWFRIAYSRNALLRALESAGRSLDELTVAEGIRSMIEFASEYRPQHAEFDRLTSTARPIDDGYELNLIRRMRRHDHPEARLTLTLAFDASGTITSRSASQS